MNKFYHITTFGCAMNTSDSERVAAVCEMMGYQRKEEINDADLIIINSCSVRQKAEDRVMGMGKKIFELKEKKPGTLAVLTGCMAMRDLRQKPEVNEVHQDNYESSLLKKLKWLDHVVEIKEIHELPKILNIGAPVDVAEYLSVKPKYNNTFQAYIPISTGCNKFCTFCIVPFTRGKEIYRPLDEIKTEFTEMSKHGFKEITLLGQNVNSWRDTDDSYKPKNDEKDFAVLLEELGKVEGDHWIRFTSSHPYDINMRLVDVIKKYPTITKHLHFALQSGDNNMLKRMNRHYTIEEFTEKVEKIRKAIPGVGVTTDIIVGFPGETEEEFNNTVKAIENIKFDQVFISEYSNRKGTLADKFYKDDIPNDIKARRKVILNEAVAKGTLERNKEMIGSTQKVLIYKHKKGYIGRTSNGKDVEILSNEDLNLGTFCNVSIEGTNSWSLTGKVLKSVHI